MARRREKRGRRKRAGLKKYTSIHLVILYAG
jgi:preprotein translocase subunit Sec61beta